MKKDLPHGKNIKLAVIFVLVVMLIITLSFLWKMTELFAESRFDGQHQFVLVLENDPIKIVCFTPENHTVAVFKLGQKIDPKEISRKIEIPVDASIKTTKEGSLQKIISGSIMHFNSDDNINIFDKIKIWWFLQSVSADNITEKNINIPVAEDVFTNIIPKFFTDKSLYQEAKTIEIINATGVSGFGARLARILGNIGGNVIMVETGMNIKDTSSLEYSGDFSYTEKRLEKILKIKPYFSGKKLVIADIIISIGKDKIATTDF